MSERVDLQEFVGGFVAEAEELVATATALLLEIERGNQEGAVKPKAVRDLFRAMHTIKGLAGMIGVEPIADIAHALEALLRIADRSGAGLRPGAVEVSVQAVRAIQERVRAVAASKPPAPAPESLLQALATTDAASETPNTPPPISSDWDARLSASERQQLYAAIREGMPVLSLTFVPSDERMARGLTIAKVRSGLGALGEIVKVAPRATPTGVAFDILLTSRSAIEAIAAAAEVEHVTRIGEPAAPVVEKAPEPEDAPALSRSLVRVDLARLDELQDQLSLLIVSRFRLEREIATLSAQGVDVRRLREIAEQQARQLRDLRRAILHARMVRVAEVLEPLALLVRSLTRPGLKEVKLEIDAREAELDKAVADRLLPAIVHLVRNAIDHAIETVDERAAAGKPRAGTLRITSRGVAGSHLELEISDDGRGIDREAIAKRANRAIVDDETLLDVLTTPGFSTRDVATQTSGRGLGMDIVKRIAVGELGGELLLATALKTGTKFTLRVPLTISIIEVFSFVCGPQTFVVPVAAIEEIIELSGAPLVPVAQVSGALAMSLLQRRGQAVPVVSLGELLAIARGGGNKALVTRRNGEAFAFSVDRMVGRHEVVVRTIDDPLARVPGVTGATDLGDGKPTLVLDLSALGLHARERAAS